MILEPDLRRHTLAVVGSAPQRLEKNCAYRLTIWSLRLPGNFRGEKKAGNHNAVRDISIESCSISWQKTWHHCGWDWLRLLSQQSHWYCHIFTLWKKVDFDSLKNIAEVTYFHFIINSHPNKWEVGSLVKYALFNKNCNIPVDDKFPDYTLAILWHVLFSKSSGVFTSQISFSMV